jgi:hypothetical protein
VWLSSVISDGATVTEVAARFRVAGKTVYDWLVPYEAGGLENLRGGVASAEVASAPDGQRDGRPDRADAGRAESLRRTRADPTDRSRPQSTDQSSEGVSGDRASTETRGCSRLVFRDLNGGV